MNRIVRTTGAVLATASLFVMAGCARDETAREYSPTDGTMVDTDEIALRNVQIITNGTGANVIVAAITNKTTTPDALVGIEVAGRPILEGEALLPGNRSVYFGSTERDGVPFVGRHNAGEYVDLTFNFRNAGEVPASVLAVANSGENGAAFEAATGLPASTEAPATAEESPKEEAAH